MSTLTLVAATPHSLKYQYIATAAGPTVSVTRAQMIIDAATAGPGPSPLLALLTAAALGADWEALPAGLDLSLLLTQQIMTVGASTLSARFDVGLTMDVDGVAVANDDAALVEVKFDSTLA